MNDVHFKIYFNQSDNSISVAACLHQFLWFSPSMLTTCCMAASRDPNSMKTLAAFDGAVDWAVDGSFTQSDVDEAKLSIFSQVTNLFCKVSRV